MSFFISETEEENEKKKKKKKEDSSSLVGLCDDCRQSINWTGEDSCGAGSIWQGKFEFELDFELSLV